VGRGAGRTSGEVKGTYTMAGGAASARQR
jgi:hypothetical protein